MRAAINIEKMKSYTMANDVLIKKLLQSFVNNIPSQLIQLKHGADTNNLTEVHYMAHKLKTPFMYIGVEDIANKLANIEDNCRAMEMDNLQHEVDDILTVGSACVAEAKELIEK